MMPLPWSAAAPEAWRLDLKDYGPTWDRGIGAANKGGRWNPVGYPVVYCSADPAAEILELPFTGVPCPRHRGSRADESAPSRRARHPRRHAGRWAESELASEESWNLLFNPDRAAGRYALDAQKRFALDPRLNPLP